jgi:hypothetical protein
MKPAFLLLLCLAVAASIYTVSVQSEKTDLEREILLLGNGLESTEADLARSQNPADPEYAYYHQSEAICQSNKQLTQEALRERRAQWSLRPPWRVRRPSTGMFNPSNIKQHPLTWKYEITF